MEEEKEREEAAYVPSRPLGAAIVAYCADAAGNCGVLGNNDGSAESATYNAREYAYSGYAGVDGNAGDEYIRIAGATNTRLTMKAFGYAAGTADAVGAQ